MTDLASVVNAINKKLKDHQISLLESQGAASGVEIPWFLSTGAMNFDWALGKGIPAGRLIEVYSRESSQGKSTVAFMITAAAQEQGAIVLFLDGENATLKSRMRAVGINPKKLIFEAPSSLEEGFRICEAAIIAIRKAYPDHEKTPILVIWDSIGATPTTAEIENEYDQATVGLQARIMSRSLKKMMSILRDNSATMICTNQTRSKIGGTAYGETMDSVGGRGLKFYAHQRVELSRIGNLKSPDKKVIGIQTRLKLVKNKICEPFREGLLNIMYADGVDRDLAELEFAVKVGLVKEETAGYYAIDGGKKFRASDYVNQKPENFDDKLWLALDANE